MCVCCCCCFFYPFKLTLAHNEPQHTPDHIYALWESHARSFSLCPSFLSPRSFNEIHICLVVRSRFGTHTHYMHTRSIVAPFRYAEERERFVCRIGVYFKRSQAMCVCSDLYAATVACLLSLLHRVLCSYCCKVCIILFSSYFFFLLSCSSVMCVFLFFFCSLLPFNGDCGLPFIVETTATSKFIMVCASWFHNFRHEHFSFVHRTITDGHTHEIMCWIRMWLHERVAAKKIEKFCMNNWEDFTY